MARKSLGVAPSGATDVDTKAARDAAIAVLAAAEYNSDAPAKHAMVEWNYDPIAGQGSSVMVAGTLYLCKITAQVSGPVSNIVINVNTAGATLTSTRNHAVLYTAAGVEMARTGDQTTVWNSVGAKIMALGSTQNLVAGTDYYVGLIGGGTTPPSPMRAGTTLAPLNVGLAVSLYRFAINGTGLTTAPSSFTPASNTATNAISYWVGLS